MEDLLPRFFGKYLAGLQPPGQLLLVPAPSDPVRIFKSNQIVKLCQNVTWKPRNAEDTPDTVPDETGEYFARNMEKKA